MRLNPEFQRNRWLEITSHRLVATPVIFGGFYYLILYFGGDGDENLLMTSLWVFIVFAGLWGAYQSENALVSEVHNKTWPLQRLTSINPWTMTWGKLFGSTLFSWYVGLWSLLVFALVLILAPEVALFPQQGRKWIMLSYGVAPALLFVVGVAVWAQAWGFLLGMWQLQNKSSKSQRRSVFSFLPLILSAPLLISLVILSFEPVKWSRPVNWYHWEINEFGFYLVSLYLFLGWLITGIYMQMRRELQMANPPWAWKAFLIFVLGYAIGFPQPDNEMVLDGLNFWVARVLVGWGLMIALSYLILLWERSDGMDVRRLFYLWNSRRIRDALCEIPRWSITLGITWVAAAGLMILHSVFGSTFLSGDGELLNLYSIVFATMFFLMRDIALLLYFYFSDKPQRALGTALVYWLVLYWLIPVLLGLVWFDFLNPVFRPDGTVAMAHAILPPMIQAIAMWWITSSRWRTRFGTTA